MKKALSFFGAMVHLVSLGQSWDTLSDFEPSDLLIKRFDIQNNVLLVFGGVCFEVNQGTFCNPMMEYDGSSFWFSLPISELGGFNCREELNGDTIYAGSVHDYMGVNYNSIILNKNGAVWSILGNGICSNSEVLDMEVYNNKLVICGSLQNVDCDDETNWMHLAAWTGSEWLPMGGVFGDSDPHELVIYDEKLYVIGDFESVSYDNTFENSLNVQNIAWYDGTTWGEPMDGVAEGRALEAIVDTLSNTLYVGGSFTNAGDTEVSRVAMWDGEEWYAVGTDLFGEVYALSFYRGQLYAGGSNLVNGESLAFFDGYHWQEVPGYNSQLLVRDLIVYDDELYVGGDFDFVDGMEAPGLAKYYLHPDSVVWGVPDNVLSLDNSPSDLIVYPNPATNQVHILTSRFIGEAAVFVLFNSSGKSLKEIPFRFASNDVLLELGELPMGTYSYQIAVSGKIAKNDILIIGR